MKEKKPFYIDALKMKKEVQKKFNQRYGHLSLEEMNKKIDDDLKKYRAKFNKNLRKNK